MTAYSTQMQMVLSAVKPGRPGPSIALTFRYFHLTEGMSEGDLIINRRA